MAAHYLGDGRDFKNSIFQLFKMMWINPTYCISIFLFTDRRLSRPMCPVQTAVGLAQDHKVTNG
jgi:hypothetical protein